MTNVLESLIEEYTLEHSKKEVVQCDIDNDFSLTALVRQRREIDEQIEETFTPYRDKMNIIHNNMNTILKKILNQKEETYYIPNLNKRTRTKKPFEIVTKEKLIKFLVLSNKEKLIEFMTLNNISTENIKNFDSSEDRINNTNSILNKKQKPTK